MKWLVFALMLLSGCSTLGQYKDPIYAAEKYRIAVAAIYAEQDLSCASSEGVFYIVQGASFEVTDEYAVVVDSHGVRHTLNPYVANPTCIPVN